VGACVGARGARVRMVTTELRGEKVDIVPYSEDAREFVMRALQPAKVKEVFLDEESGTATVIVNDYQLSLAIGKEGQNARLAARLTGWRIDIKSESQLAEEEAYAAQEWAEGEWVQNEAGEMVWQPAGGGEALSAEEWEATTAGGNGPPESDFEVDLVGDAGTVLEGTVLDGADPSTPDLVGDVPAVVPAAGPSEAESNTHDQEGADGAASAVEGAG
jgi:transcription termination/antitermination protein NusA